MAIALDWLVHSESPLPSRGCGVANHQRVHPLPLDGNARRRGCRACGRPRAPTAAIAAEGEADQRFRPTGHHRALVDRSQVPATLPLPRIARKAILNRAMLAIAAMRAGLSPVWVSVSASLADDAVRANDFRPVISRYAAAHTRAARGHAVVRRRGRRGTGNDSARRRRRRPKAPSTLTSLAIGSELSHKTAM